MIPAARLKSEALPPEAAIIKSAGEQSQGQALLQGFVAQYSHRLISLINWASVRYISISLNHSMLAQAFTINERLGICQEIPSVTGLGSQYPEPAQGLDNEGVRVVITHGIGWAILSLTPG